MPLYIDIFMEARYTCIVLNTELHCLAQSDSVSEAANIFTRNICLIYRGSATVDERHTFRVVFPILKGKQLCIHYSDRESSYSTKRISVTRITTGRMGQI